MANALARFALKQRGTPFLLHGRVAGQGLDCVGLVLHCLNQCGFNIDVPPIYRLRGDYGATILRLMENPPFQPVNGNACEGDIAAAHIAPCQFHLMIAVERGWVHAHAGLGRVVLTPAPLRWPLLGIWRV